jgi:hypothetical protein
MQERDVLVALHPYDTREKILIVLSIITMLDSETRAPSPVRELLLVE